MKHRVKIIQIIMVLLLLLLQFLSPAAPASAVETFARVQPLLAEVARQSPTTLVNVIVQKQSNTGRLEAQVEQAGGAIVAELGIINAFAAEMPGVVNIV